MKPLTLLLAGLFFAAVCVVAGIRIHDPPFEVFKSERVVVAHWTTGHLTRDGLLKDMAMEFNKAGHRIGSGTKIRVEVYDAPLNSRVCT